LGIPSIAVLLFMAFAWVSLRPGTPATANSTDIGKYGIIGLLQSGAFGVARSFEFFGGVSRWVAGVLVVLSLVATLVSAALFYTGRGLFHHDTWARVTGGLVALGLLLVSAVCVGSLPRGGALASLLFLGASGYAIWVLGWRF
jgi:hypothetical protein